MRKASTFSLWGIKSRSVRHRSVAGRELAPVRGAFSSPNQLIQLAQSNINLLLLINAEHFKKRHNQE